MAGVLGCQHTSADPLPIHFSTPSLIREHPSGLFRLVTVEEAADHWASGRALSNNGRALGYLMKGPRTSAELAALVGVSHDSAQGIINRLRSNDHNIECRGPRPGTYHLLSVDARRYPWMHLGAMDLRGAALDDQE